MDGRFIQMSLPSLDTEEDEKKDSQPEEDDKRESTPARETSTEQMQESFDSTPTTPIGRTETNRTRSPKSLTKGTSNLKLHDRMTEQHLEQATRTVSGDPATITIVDKNGNENRRKQKY